MHLDETLSDLEAAKAQVKSLPPHRVAAVIEAEINAMQKDRFWAGSQSCTDPSGREAQNFCKKLSDRRTELVSATTADRLAARVEQLSREAEGLKRQGAGQEKDPQAVMLSVLSGMNVEDSKKAIIVFVALLVELGAAFGLFLATGHSFNHLPSSGPTKGPAPINLSTVNANRGTVTPELQREERALIPVHKPLQPLQLELSEDGALWISQAAQKA